LEQWTRSAAHEAGCAVSVSYAGEKIEQGACAALQAAAGTLSEVVT
jgi:hypothetical protein